MTTCPPPPSFVAPSPPVRLGLIGAGAWGWRYVPAAEASGVARVTHVARWGGAPPEATSHLTPLTRVSDWREMLGAPVDAIVCAAPPHAHESICTFFLNNMRPVMCEKPMTLSRAAADHVTACARESGVPFLVNHQHLFSAAYEELFERTAHDSSLHVVSYGGGDVTAPRSYSALWDVGAHDAAMAVGLIGSLAGEVRVVSASLNGGLFRFALEGAQGQSMSHVWRGPPRRRRLSVTTSQRHYVYDPLREGATLSVAQCLRDLVDPTPVPLAYEPPLTRAVRVFATAVRTGREDWRFVPEFAYRVVDVLARVESAFGLEGLEGSVR